MTTKMQLANYVRPKASNAARSCGDLNGKTDSLSHIRAPSYGLNDRSGRRTRCYTTTSCCANGLDSGANFSTGGHTFMSRICPLCPKTCSILFRRRTCFDPPFCHWHGSNNIGGRIEIVAWFSQLSLWAVAYICSESPCQAPPHLRPFAFAMRSSGGASSRSTKRRLLCIYRGSFESHQL